MSNGIVHTPTLPRGDLGFTKYVMAVVIIGMVSVIAYMTITTQRPSWDKLVIIGSIFSFFSVSSWQVITFMKAEDSRLQSRQTYYQVNDRFDDFKRELQEKSDRLVREGYALGLRDGAKGATGPDIVKDIIAEKPYEKT
jgi:hypothetical protein